MSDFSGEEIGLKLADKTIERKVFNKIGGFSPSMKLVVNILENHGAMTQKEITRITHLPARTVRYALNRLKEEDFLEEREYYQDARQSLYGIKQGNREIFA